jgi:hypothetical protein
MSPGREQGIRNVEPCKGRVSDHAAFLIVGADFAQPSDRLRPLPDVQEHAGDAPLRIDAIGGRTDFAEQRQSLVKVRARRARVASVQFAVAAGRASRCMSVDLRAAIRG